MNVSVVSGLRPFFNLSPPEGEKAPPPLLPGLYPTSLFTSESLGGSVSRNRESVVLTSHDKLATHFQFRFLFVCPCPEVKASFKKKNGGEKL